MKVLIALLFVFSLFAIGEAFACALPGMPPDSDPSNTCCFGVPDSNFLCPDNPAANCCSDPFTCPSGGSCDPAFFGDCASGYACSGACTTNGNPPGANGCCSGIICGGVCADSCGGGGSLECCSSSQILQPNQVCDTGSPSNPDIFACQNSGLPGEYDGAIFTCPAGQTPVFDDGLASYRCEYGPNPACIDYLTDPTTGECIYDGSCRGDGQNYIPSQGGGYGTVCCGDPSLDPYVDGVIENFTYTTAPYRPATGTCAWHNETTFGTHQCTGGAQLQVPYWRDACTTNSDSRPTRLITAPIPETTDLTPGAPQPTHYIYTYPQQEIISNAAWPWCASLSLDPTDPSELECPEGYEQFHELTELTASCDTNYYGDGLGEINYWGIGCRQEAPPPQAAEAQPYTAYGCRDGFCLCSGEGVYPTCRSGYTEGTRTYDYTATTNCHIMGGYSLPSSYTPSDVECIPNPAPPPCGNGVCASGETPASCPQDCTQTTYSYRAICSAGYTWNNAQGRCMAQCGEPGTTGTNCNDLMAPALANYYCSQGYNNAVSPQSYCCPVGTYWNPALMTCTGSQTCYSASQCPYLPSDSEYFNTPACVSTSANQGAPGACCSVGMKDGLNPFYDYSDANGNTNNNFRIY